MRILTVDTKSGYQMRLRFQNGKAVAVMWKDRGQDGGEKCRLFLEL